MSARGNEKMKVDMFVTSGVIGIIFPVKMGAAILGNLQFKL